MTGSAGSHSAGSTERGRAVLLSASERVATPWRNGGGVTTVVAWAWAGGGGVGTAAIGTASDADPRADPCADPDWRVSIATISKAGAFSMFPAVDRVLVPLSPAGLTLRVGGRIRRLAQHETISFTGEETVAAIDVTSEGDDLNLMTRRGVCDGSVEMRSIDGSVLFEAGDRSDGNETVLVLVLEGHIVWREQPLPGRDALLLSPGACVRLTGRGTVAVATVSRRSLETPSF